MILKNTKGITLTELVVVMVVLSILASVAMPIYRMSIKRAKEATLRAELRQMRDAINAYKKLSDDGWIPRQAGDTGYPKTLEDLTKQITSVQTVTGTNQAAGTKKIRLLRSKPIDPMTGKDEWGMRSNEDDLDSISWGGQDVFDVYSLSEETALDGTKYKDW